MNIKTEIAIAVGAVVVALVLIVHTIGLVSTARAGDTPFVVEPHPTSQCTSFVSLPKWHSRLNSTAVVVSVVCVGGGGRIVVESRFVEVEG